MSRTAPTFSQIRAQVAAIRKHAKDSRVFGIYSPSRWNGETHQSFDDELYHIVQCDSPLALRVALQEKTDDATTKVVVTGIPTETLSADIRARLARRKLYPIKNWQIVKELFQARQLDPRIVEHNWIAERLLDLAPPEGFPPVPSGVLDAETVWGILLEHDLGLVVARPDLIALLKWSMELGNVSRFRSQSDEFRQAATEWIAQSAGPATDAVFACMKKNERPDALPVGLVMSVVYSPDAAACLKTEAARLEERYVGPNRINDLNSRLWRDAATNLVRLHLPDARVRSEWLSRADEILRDVDAEKFAYVSCTSPLGFEQRLNTYGKALALAASSRVTKMPTSVDEAYQRVLEHEHARWHQESRRMLRVQMSARLLRWLAEVNLADNEDNSLALACRRHASEGGFVDWARSTLNSNDHARDLTDAYNELLAAATDVIQKRNRQFAKLAADWTQSGAGGDDVLPVEDVLEKFVSPLAAHAPLLVLVIDGMSFGVFRELIADITRQDWAEIRRQDREPIWPAIATLPSLTEISRTSLLSGKLQQGSSTTERAAFESHPDLLHHCRSNSPPKLFHKSALQGSEDSPVPEEVIKEIESTKRRIVGVVINAVDDYLLKGDQLDIRWTSEDIKVLPSLLSEAKAAGRLVLLLSDHGHVLDRHSKLSKHDGGDRWRHIGEPSDGEIEVSGSRVLAPSGPDSNKLVVPWSEKLRYSMKKNGYHGGISLQEMVIPMAVLSNRDDLPDGWIEPSSDTPDWWFEPLQEPAAGEFDIEAPTPEPAKPKAGLLFDLEEPEQPAPTEKSPDQIEGPIWIQELFRSEVYQEQRKLAGRKPPADDIIQSLLLALHVQGGKMTLVALARQIKLPSQRLPLLLAAVKRVVNVEGYSILITDDSSETVELDRELLCRQFGLT